jgi:hypothetical protein
VIASNSETLASCPTISTTGQPGHLNELAQCDRDDLAAENAEMRAPALIFISLGIAVASFAAHETIGGTLRIIGVIAGFV